jgi:hypothetical protein
MKFAEIGEELNGNLMNGRKRGIFLGQKRKLMEMLKKEFWEIEGVGWKLKISVAKSWRNFTEA